MALFAKDPAAAIDYTVDWSGGYLEPAETLASSGWQIAPVEAGGLVVDSDVAGATATTATLSGGLAGHVYRVTNRVTTSAGRVDERSLMIRVQQR